MHPIKFVYALGKNRKQFCIFRYKKYLTEIHSSWKYILHPPSLTKSSRKFMMVTVWWQVHSWSFCRNIVPLIITKLPQRWSIRTKKSAFQTLTTIPAAIPQWVIWARKDRIINKTTKFFHNWKKPCWSSWKLFTYLI